MALLVYLHKEEETATSVRYRFHTDGGTARHLVLDKQTETILPDDGNADGIFRAAAGKLARAWVTGRTPETLVHQS